ncbi:translation initiation factor IF-2-like [Mesocricetus auratus]|uniref:Translation initiation factor IF-2-like n=1 Tax=Mesocricetus auratus TaxID=10036 RepID=A0ABM2X4S2_MESAU|nr:translation initiation factor IF-2-like [Mesocricetus auratus]
MQTFINSRTLLPRLLEARSEVPGQWQGRSGEQEEGSRGEPLPTPTPPPPPATPRGTQGLLLRDASELLRRPRSREPPGRVQGRAAARLGPRGPSRAGSARTHIPQRRSRQPPRSPRPDGRLREPGPRPRRRRRASSPRAGARPACQRGGRPSAAAAAPLSAQPRLPAAHATPTAEPVPALPGPHAPSARLATRAQSPLRGGLRRGRCLRRAA